MNTRWFMEYLCGRIGLVLVLHALLWIALVLNTATLLALGIESESAPVAVFNYPGIVFILLFSGYTLYWCRKNDAV